MVLIDTVVQGTRPVRDHVHASHLALFDSECPSLFFLAQQLGGPDEITGTKLVQLGVWNGFEQPSPDHLGVVMVYVGRCHVKAGMNVLVVAGYQFRRGVQVLWGVVGCHVLVGEFFEHAIETFGHEGFGFPWVEKWWMPYWSSYRFMCWL